MAIEQIIISLLYRRFAIANYEEAKLNYTFNRKISKKLLNFTSWNLLANISQSFKIQGTSIILNMFFTPAIVAAQSIASQVAAQTMQLYNNFKTAIDPQIVKLYAAGEYEQSHNLVLKSTVYVFDLCLLIGIPLFLLMDYIMEIWLVEVPPYAVAFSRLLIIQNIIDSIQNMFYSSLVASGKLKVNSVLGFIIVTLALIILLVVYKCGGNVLWVQYIYIVVAFIQSFIVRPLILVKEVQYNLRDLYTTIFTCVKVAGLSVLLIVPVMVFKCDLYGYNFVILVVSVLSVILSSYVFLDREAKLYINKIIKEKLSLI